MKYLANKFPLLFGIAAFILFYFFLCSIETTSILMQGLIRILAAIVMIIIVWPVLKDRWLKNPREGWGTSFKLCRPLIITSCLVGIVSLGFILVGSVLLDSNNGLNLKTECLIPFIEMLVLCLGIGVAEEIGFRRALYGCALEQFKDKKNALMIITIICSLFFGFLHVTFSFSADPIVIITALLKTLESAMFAFILSGALLESKNIWPISIIHALTDFLPLLSVALFNDVTNTNYVTTTSDSFDGYTTILLYGVYILVYLPRTIKIFKKIKNNEYTY